MSNQLIDYRSVRTLRAKRKTSWTILTGSLSCGLRKELQLQRIHKSLSLSWLAALDASTWPWNHTLCKVEWPSTLNDCKSLFNLANRNMDHKFCKKAESNDESTVNRSLNRPTRYYCSTVACCSFPSRPRRERKEDNLHIPSCIHSLQRWKVHRWSGEQLKPIQDCQWYWFRNGLVRQRENGGAVCRQWSRNSGHICQI